MAPRRCPAARSSADRVLAWLDELIERTCPTPPVARWADPRRRHRGPLRQRPRCRPAQPAGACRHARPGALPAGAEFGRALTEFLGTDRGHARPPLAAMRLRSGPPARADGRELGSVKAYNLDRARTPSLQATQHSLMEQFGMPAIPPAELERDRRSDDPDLGAARSGDAAADRRGRERPLRLAAARDRGCRRRSAHGAARSFLESAATRRSAARDAAARRQP